MIVSFDVNMALEQAELMHGRALLKLETVTRERHLAERNYCDALIERDEARRWARRFYKENQELKRKIKLQQEAIDYFEFYD